MREDYDIVIGLEVHAELKTNSKVFCSCPNSFGDEPNTNCCPVCIALPGALPVLNKKAVESTIKAGLCMGCDINDIAVFERKNYFYPDLSKAYQISQLVKPICINGGVLINNGAKFVRLDRIHLEEDAGKLIHKNEQVGTLIDYNRGGVPLIEMVSKPDLSNADEAIEFLNALRNNLIYAGLAECKMEQGGMRCDVNISVKKKGSDVYGTRTEMKNLNSFKSVARAIEYESNRQIELLDKGEQIRQETRKWDDEKGKSFALRGKEDSQDYRYFPDPDLIPVRISRDLVDNLSKEIPALPQALKQKYINDYSLSNYDAEQLISSKQISDFFEATLEKYNQPKKVANWIMTEVIKYIQDNDGQTKITVSVNDFVDILQMFDNKQISQQNAKKLIEICSQGQNDAKQIAKEQNMLNDISNDEIESIIEQILQANPKAVDDFAQNGEKVMSFFVGQVMRATKGKANPDDVKSYILNKLGK